jgi:hypothetical protein
MENGYSQFRKRRTLITIVTTIALVLLIVYLVTSGHKKTVVDPAFSSISNHIPQVLFLNKALSVSGWPVMCR